MKPKRLTYGMALVLFLLLCCKVSAFHVYTHQDEVSDTEEICTVCELAVLSQKADLAYPVTDLPEPCVVYCPSRKEIVDTSEVFYTRFRESDFICRPPPSII